MIETVCRNWHHSHVYVTTEASLHFNLGKHWNFETRNHSTHGDSSSHMKTGNLGNKGKSSNHVNTGDLGNR